MSDTNTSFIPFSKSDLERVKAAKEAALQRGGVQVKGVPMIDNGHGQQIPNGRVAARHAAEQEQHRNQILDPRQRAGMDIQGRDSDAQFGRHADGRPMTVAEFAQQRLGAKAAPVSQAPTIGGDPRLAQMHMQRTGVAQVQPTQYQEQIPAHQAPVQDWNATSVSMQPVPHNAPTFVNEAEGIAVQLPSQFAFYPFKDLFVYPLKGYHLSKLARAHAEKSELIMLEVVSSVIRTSDPRFEGYPLAKMMLLGDYYWLLYYLRRNNYTKSAFVHTTQCLDHNHLQAVQEGKKTQDSLKIQQVINESVLKETLLTQMPVIDEDVLNGLVIRPATMQDMVETMEHPSFGQDEEFDYLSQLACYLPGPTLQARIESAKELTPDQISAIQEYEKILGEFGVEETINVRCPECGAQRRTRVRISASTFLPS